MPQDGRGVDESPLLGPNGRIPTVQAVTLTRPSGFTTLRKGWVPRHTSCALLAGIAVPVAAVLLNQATGPLDAALALGILSLGLWQRLSGTSAC